jgi:hypothetical protein
MDVLHTTCRLVFIVPRSSNQPRLLLLRIPVDGRSKSTSWSAASWRYGTLYAQLTWTGLAFTDMSRCSIYKQSIHSFCLHTSNTERDRREFPWPTRTPEEFFCEEEKLTPLSNLINGWLIPLASFMVVGSNDGAAWAQLSFRPQLALSCTPFLGFNLEETQMGKIATLAVEEGARKVFERKRSSVWFLSWISEASSGWQPQLVNSVTTSLSLGTTRKRIVPY